MRKSLSLIILVVLQSCSLFSDVLSLSNFSKDIIGEYHQTSSENSTIILTQEDTLYWYMKITSGEHINWFSNEDYIGKVKNNHSDVYIYGLNDCIFYSANRKHLRNNRPRVLKNDITPEIIDEPCFWQIAIRKDTTFSKYRTYIVNPFEDISTIQRIANKYYKNAQLSKEELFDYIEVEQPAEPIVGINGIRDIIRMNFRFKSYEGENRIPIAVKIIVYSDGVTEVNGFYKRTNDEILNAEALRVADLIIRTGFLPAKHRGEKVNSTFCIPFVRKDIGEGE